MSISSLKWNFQICFWIFSLITCSSSVSAVSVFASNVFLFRPFLCVEERQPVLVLGLNMGFEMLSESTGCEKARLLVSHALDGDPWGVPHPSTTLLLSSVVRQCIFVNKFLFGCFSVPVSTIRLMQSLTVSIFFLFSQRGSKTSLRTRVPISPWPWPCTLQ